MRLTRYTDFSMRILLCLGAQPNKVWPIGEIARAYGVSQNHLVKVAHDLVKAGYLEGVRGRAGGIRLARPADEIIVGEVVRQMEQGFQLVDCAGCLIAPACGLSGVIDEALAAFMAVLDSYTLADLMKKNSSLAGLFDLASPAERPTRTAVAKR
jgi:Rrf2 family transcriptional regulator, nitric oxide-sensitive transcriptional repressor